MSPVRVAEARSHRSPVLLRLATSVEVLFSFRQRLRQNSTRHACCARKLAARHGMTRCSPPDKKAVAEKLKLAVRTKLGEDLALINTKHFEFCWIVDFLMFEQRGFGMSISRQPVLDAGRVEGAGRQDRSPSMPISARHRLQRRGNLARARSGTICRRSCVQGVRDRRPLGQRGRNAFRRHAERVQVRAHRRMAARRRASTASSCCWRKKNIREVIAFPLNQRAEDLLMQAPAEVPSARLKELHLKLDLPLVKKVRQNSRLLERPMKSRRELGSAFRRINGDR